MRDFAFLAIEGLGSIWLAYGMSQLYLALQLAIGAEDSTVIATGICITSRK
jgi:hypothetical protein